MSVDRKYADLHIHSKFSRACSRDCDLEHLAAYAAEQRELAGAPGPAGTGPAHGEGPLA